MKLTDRQVHGFPLVPNGRKEYADDAVPGLSVRIGKTAKTFRLVIWSRNWRKHFTIGTYDRPRFTLAMAREKARDIIAKERLHPQEPVSAPPSRRRWRSTTASTSRAPAG